MRGVCLRERSWRYQHLGSGTISLTASHSTGYELFGYSVAVSGDSILIGALLTITSVRRLVLHMYFNAMPEHWVGGGSRGSYPRILHPSINLAVPFHSPMAQP